MENILLNNEIKMPVLGFGLFQIDDHQQCKQAVVQAIESGYRLIDTAASYMNEEAVGEGIIESSVPREELFITTKLWVQDTGYARTKEAFQRSLKRLKLDYIDLYLIRSEERRV